MSASRRRRWRRRARPFPFEQQDRKEAKAAAVKHRDFAIYGLDETWAGRRWVGGWGSTGDRITNITLAHGNVWNEDAPLVRVETAPVGDDDEFARADTAQGLAATLFHDTDEYLPQTGDTFRPIDPTASWEQTSIDLDGTNTPFRLLLSGPWWVALGEVPGCLISIEARHFDPKDVHLVTIDSAE